MEENNGCVLIKKRDYESLKEKARRTEPKKIGCIVETITAGSFEHVHYTVRSNIDLDSGVRGQILRIYSKVMDRFKMELEHVQANVKKKLLFDLANMSRKERRRFLKQYKNK